MIINKKGFSIIELLVYIGVGSILLTSIAVFSVKIIEVRERSFLTNEVESQGIFIMNKITSEIKNAENINQPTFSNSGNILSLQVADLNRNPLIFDVSSGVLRMQEGSNTPVNLSNNEVIISDLSFSNMSSSTNPGNVKVEFTISHVNNSKISSNYSKTFTNSASLRY